MVGIYKITNSINGKIYIGQSINIERRFSEHCRKNETLIDKEIQKIGKDFFTFEVIEKCSLSELDNREIYWIKYYNSLFPSGYNCTEGGNSSNGYYGYIDHFLLQQIIDDIKNSELTFSEISNKYNINVSNVSRINAGETHRQENENYPLRERENYPQIKNFHNENNNFRTTICPICGNKKSSKAQTCFQCYAINNRQNIRPSREELKNLIRNTPFQQIGKMYGVRDNTIRKWCKKENLPTRKIDINNYSEEEWNKI